MSSFCFYLNICVIQVGTALSNHVNLPFNQKQHGLACHSVFSLCRDLRSLLSKALMVYSIRQHVYQTVT